MTNTKIDSVLAIETPEGVDIRLTPAPIGLRACAWLLDVVIKSAIYTLAYSLIILIGVLAGKMVMAAMLLFMFFMEWFYGALCEGRFGATPGKRCMGLQVVAMRGTPLTWEQAILRNFLWIVDFFPFLYGTAIISMLFSQGQRRLGDLAAGTLVTMAPETIRKRNQLQQERELAFLLRRRIDVSDLEPAAPPLALLAEEKALLASFFRRSQRYNQAYRVELASMLHSMHAHLSPAEGERRLRSYGAWLSGQGAQTAAGTAAGAAAQTQNGSPKPIRVTGSRR